MAPLPPNHLLLLLILLLVAPSKALHAQHGNGNTGSNSQVPTPLHAKLASSLRYPLPLSGMRPPPVNSAPAAVQVPPPPAQQDPSQRSLSHGTHTEPPAPYELCSSYLLNGKIQDQTMVDMEFIETGESCVSMCSNDDCPEWRDTRVFASKEPFTPANGAWGYPDSFPMFMYLNDEWMPDYPPEHSIALYEPCKRSSNSYSSSMAQFLFAPVDLSEYDNGYFDPTKTSGSWATVKHTPDADGWYQMTNVIITCKAGTEYTECPKNYYLEDDVCVACPSHLESSHQGATSVSDCFTIRANAVVSCPFASRLVAYNNDVGENERLAESGEIGFETLKDIAFVSSDRFLTLNYNQILEYDVDGDFKGVFAEDPTTSGTQRATLTSLHVFTPTDSDELYVAVSRDDIIHVTTYAKGKDGGSIDLEEERSSSSMYIDLGDIDRGGIALDGGITLNAEMITSMTQGATADEILVTTSFWFDEVPEGETEASQNPGGRLVRVCVPTKCTKPPINKVQNLYYALTAVVTLPSKGSKGSILYVEKGSGSGTDWQVVREIPLDDDETFPFPTIFMDLDATTYKPTDIVVDDKLRLVYIESPDLTRVYNYNGIYLQRFEEKIGYTTEPDQLAFKPGIFAHLSSYETYTDVDDVFPNTTVVAGETLTAKVMLRDRYNEQITENLNEYEKSRFTLTASGDIAFDGKIYATQVGGSINLDATKPAATSIHGEIVIEKAGPWKLTLTEGTKVVQTVGTDVQINVIPAKTDPGSCTLNTPNTMVTTAGESFRIEIASFDRFNNPTHDSSDEFITWFQNKDYGEHTLGKTMNRIFDNKGNHTNRFEIDRTLKEAGDERVHVAHKSCIESSCSGHEGLSTYSTCIADECEIRGSPISVTITPADVNPSKCHANSIPSDFESHTTQVEKIKVLVRVFDSFNNTVPGSDDDKFTLVVEGIVDPATNEKKYGAEAPIPLNANMGFEIDLDIPPKFDGKVTYKITYFGDDQPILGSPYTTDVFFVETISNTTILVIVGGLISAVLILYLLHRSCSKRMENHDNVTELQEMATNIMAFGFDSLDHLTDWVNYVNVLRYTGSRKIYYIMFLGTGLVSTSCSIIINFLQLNQLRKNRNIAPDDEMTPHLSSLELWARENDIDAEIKRREDKLKEIADERRNNMKENRDASSKKQRATVRLSISNPFTSRKNSEVKPEGMTAYDKLRTKRKGKFEVKQGTILPTMSGTFRKGAAMTAVETKLNDTRIELLQLLRERHEHTVDKFLTARAKLRALIGLTVVICEDTPLLGLQFYDIVYGCDYDEYYTEQARADHYGDCNDYYTEKVSGFTCEPKRGLKCVTDDNVFSFEAGAVEEEIGLCATFGDRKKFMFLLGSIFMTTWLVGWKLKDVNELQTMNRRMHTLDILIKHGTEKAEELIKDINMLVEKATATEVVTVNGVVEKKQDMARKAVVLGGE